MAGHQSHFTKRKIFCSPTAVYEASAKLAAGTDDPNLLMLVGSTTNGLFDQCLDVSLDSFPSDHQNNKTTGTFRSQFCTIFFRLESVGPDDKLLDDQDTQSMRYRVLEWPKSRAELDLSYSRHQAGFCLPSSCSAEDLRSAVAQLVGHKVVESLHPGKNLSVVQSVFTLSNENYCYTRDKILSYQNDLDGLDVVYLAVAGLLIALILSAAVLSGKNNGRPTTLLGCFSVVGILRKILSTNPDDLGCLNGIRVLSTAWIVLYHHYHYAATQVPLAYNGPSSTSKVCII